MALATTILFVSLIIAGSIVFVFLKFLQTKRDLQATLKAAQWLATIYAGVAFVYTIASVARLIVTRKAPDSTLPITSWLPDGLKTLPSDDGTILENLRFETITADVAGIPLDAALLLAGSIILNGVLQIGIALALRSLAGGCLKGTPFRAQLVRLTQSLAWIILICGLTAPILEGFGNTALAAESLSAWELTGGLSSAPSPNLAIFISFWPIGVFLMLYTLSAILESGEQLQKSTEGLV